VSCSTQAPHPSHKESKFSTRPQTLADPHQHWSQGPTQLPSLRTPSVQQIIQDFLKFIVMQNRSIWSIHCLLTLDLPFKYLASALWADSCISFHQSRHLFISLSHAESALTFNPPVVEPYGVNMKWPSYGLHFPCGYPRDS